MYRGTDQSLRLFDSDSGMMLIEPMADMEVDRLAIQGRHLVARCGGGQAMMVFKYTDGSEELDEESFVSRGIGPCGPYPHNVELDNT